MDDEQPQPPELKRLSPSLANDLFACFYRAAFRIDGRFDALRRQSPAAALGVVAHAVIEDLGRGLLTNATPEEAESLVEDRWLHHLETQAAVLERTWAPATPPAPEDWPGYHLTKARVLRRALRRAVGGPVPGRPTRPSTAIEQMIEDQKTGLYGRPDRVEGPSSARRVVDLKTGLTQAEPSESQLRQLLLYAYLVTTTGDTVASVAIEDASGRRWEQPVQPGQLEATAEESQARRAEFAAAMAASDPSASATPAADICKWCAYRLVCQPYWQHLELGWLHGSVAGQVKDVRRTRAGQEMTVAVESPTDAQNQPWLISGAPEDLATAGQHLALVDAEVSGANGHLRWRWSSMARVE